MKYNTTKRKISKMLNKNLEIDYELTRKSNTKKLDIINSDSYKTPKIIYDSDWQPVPEETMAWNEDNKPALMQWSNTYSNGVPNTKAPVDLFYIFQEEIDIPASMIPFVKVGVQYKKQPLIDSATFVNHTRQATDTRDHYEIRGDGNLIYKGYNIQSSFHYPSQYTDEEIDNGDLLAKNTSNWYEATINYTDGGDSYVLNGSVENLIAYYNVSVGGGGYNYDKFELKGMTSFSSSSVTGKGTHTSVTWEYDAETETWEEVIVVTKNVTKSVNYRSDTFHMTVVLGSLYKNGDKQSGTSFDVHSTGTIDPGTANISSITTLSLGTYRLFYTPLFARTVTLSGTNAPGLPAGHQYQTEVVPYSDISFQKNIDPYPILTEKTNYKTGEQRITWIKLPNEDPSKDKYQLVIYGTIYLMMPATVSIESQIYEVDENYSSTGDSYVLDGQNRFFKTYPDYKPDITNQEIKLQLSLVNPLYYTEIQKKDKEELD